MRFVLRKDIKLRSLVIKQEKRNKFFKAILRCHFTFSFVDLYNGVFLTFSKNFIGKVKNRCKFTFSKHSIIRFYHLGRNAFRTNASFSTFFGLQKSSW